MSDPRLSVLIAYIRACQHCPLLWLLPMYVPTDSVGGFPYSKLTPAFIVDLRIAILTGGI